MGTYPQPTKENLHENVLHNLLSRKFRDILYTVAGNVCGELNIAVCDFDGILQTFLLEIFNYLTFARVLVHVSNSQSVSHVFAALFHFKFATAFFWVWPSLMPESLRKANKRVASLCEETSPVPKRSKTAYVSYSAEDCACIEKYAAEHGHTKAMPHHGTSPHSLNDQSRNPLPVFSRSST